MPINPVVKATFRRIKTTTQHKTTNPAQIIARHMTRYFINLGTVTLLVILLPLLYINNNDTKVRAYLLLKIFTIL